MSRLFTIDLATALTDLLNGLEFLEDRGIDTQVLSSAVLMLVSTLAHFDRDRGGEPI